MVGGGILCCTVAARVGTGYATLVPTPENHGTNFKIRFRQKVVEGPGVTNGTTLGYLCLAMGMPFGLRTSSDTTIRQFWYILTNNSVTASATKMRWDLLERPSQALSNGGTISFILGRAAEQQGPKSGKS